MLVSIIIPTFNRARTIVPVVESALAQSYGEIEVIVVDDGSCDDTASVLEPLLNRIQYIYQENAGPSAARNRGVAAAKGEILAFLDSDDFWNADKIEKQVAVFVTGGPDLCCVVCSASMKDAKGQELGNTFEMAGLKIPVETGVWNNPQEILATRFILFNQVVAVRRRFFEQVGGFNEKLRILEDYELAMKLSGVGPWGVIREALVLKIDGEDGIGVGCIADEDKHLRACIEVMGGIYYTGHGLKPAAKHLLGVELLDMHDEMRSRALIRRGGIMISVGKILRLGIRARKAIRRRMPSWPKPEVFAIQIH